MLPHFFVNNIDMQNLAEVPVAEPMAPVNLAQ